MWTHTKRQTDRALGPPKALLKRLHRGSQDVTDDSDEDVEGRSLPDYRWAIWAPWAYLISPSKLLTVERLCVGQQGKPALPCACACLCQVMCSSTCPGLLCVCPILALRRQ